MLDNVTSSTADRVGALVAEVLSRRGVRERLPAAADLARFGLTSIDMVEVMLGVEAEFDLVIPPRDITLDNFRSVDAIGSLVERLAHPL